MDWNWFFAALAQSVAAIVAIFAAFVSTKIIGSQVGHRNNEKHATDLAMTSVELVGRASGLKFEWYNAYMVREALRKLGTRLRDRDTFLPSDFVKTVPVSSFVSEAEFLQRISAEMDGYVNRRVDVGPTDEERKLLATVPGNHEKEFELEGERIADVLYDVREHARHVNSFLIHLKWADESSALITWAIVGSLVLFYAGVIWPLSFLPMHEGTSPAPGVDGFLPLLLSFRGALLVIVSVTFTVMLGAFAVINSKLRYGSELKDTLERFSSPSRYSRFIAVAEEKRRS